MDRWMSICEQMDDRCIGEVGEQADGKMDLWMNRWIHVWMD